MGRRLVALGYDDPDLTVSAAIECEGHPAIGSDAGLLAGVGEIGIKLDSQLDSNSNAVIDFSIPDGAEAITKACVAQRVPLVMATTGLNENQQDLLVQAAATIPVVWAPNMSLAVNLTMQLAQIAARTLRDHPSGTDVEIIERHHRFKEDAPLCE